MCWLANLCCVPVGALGLANLTSQRLEQVLGQPMFASQSQHKLSMMTFVYKTMGISLKKNERLLLTDAVLFKKCLHT